MRLPTIPEGCTSNYHIFGLITETLERRTALINHLKARGVLAVFHYVPLHTSPMGLKMGYRAGMLPVTESLSDRLLRLPLYPTLTAEDIQHILDGIYDFFGVRQLASDHIAQAS
jgi:dTDP-4-amino-4,6-dideoxygalactose transaminase